MRFSSLIGGNRKGRLQRYDEERSGLPAHVASGGDGLRHLQGCCAPHQRLAFAFPLGPGPDWADREFETGDLGPLGDRVLLSESGHAWLSEASEVAAVCIRDTFPIPNPSHRNLDGYGGRTKSLF